MTKHGVMVWAVAALTGAAAWAIPQAGDYLVASHTYGSIYAVDPVTGLIRELVSGPELRDLSGAIQGGGPSLAASFETAIEHAQDQPIYVRFGLNSTTFGLATVTPATGDRAFVAGTMLPVWYEVGEIRMAEANTLLVVSDDWNTGNPLAAGKVLRYALETGITTVLSDRTVGDGPIMLTPRGIGQLDASRAVCVEFNIYGYPYSGVGVFIVDLTTGQRTFLSRLSVRQFNREEMSGGQSSGAVPQGPGGEGPVMNAQSRSIVVINGRIFVGVSIRRPDQSFAGGILEIDPPTGNRTLLVGEALADDGTGQTVVSAGGAYLDAPVGLMEAGNGRLAFTCRFGPNAIFEYDLSTGLLYQIADLTPQLNSAYVANLQLTGLAVYRGCALPQVVEPPVGQSVAAGQAATFSAAAQGPGPLRYAWHKDGTPLADDGRIVGAATAALTIDPVRYGDAGEYAVVVTNACGAVASAAATLTVLPAVCRGDGDCDGRIGFSDIDFFVAAIPDNAAGWVALYAARHGGSAPPCPFLNSDCNGDGHVNFADIDPFVALVPSTCP